MKRLILITLFLCVAVSAQASKVITPSPTGHGTYAELDCTDTQEFTCPVEVGGDYSKLILNNNTEDNDDNEYGIRFLQGVLYGRDGEVDRQLWDGGIDTDLAGIYGVIPGSPIPSAFGEMLSGEVTTERYNPVLPLTRNKAGHWIIGNGYRHEGADVLGDSTGYFTDGLITFGDTPTTWLLSAGGYLEDTIIAEADVRKAEIPHTGIANPRSIEFVGKIDCVGSTMQGSSGSTSGATVGLIDTMRAMITVGWSSEQTDKDLNYHIAVDPIKIDTGIPVFDGGPITFRVLVSNIRATLIDYEAYVNGGLLASGEDLNTIYDWSVLSDIIFQMKTRTSGTITGGARLRSYGSLTVYTVTP